MEIPVKFLFTLWTFIGAKEKVKAVRFPDRDRYLAAHLVRDADPPEAGVKTPFILPDSNPPYKRLTEKSNSNEISG